MCLVSLLFLCCFCFFKRKTAYEMRISAWGSDVCSSGLFFLLAGRVLDAMRRDRARSGIAALLGRMGRGAHVAQPDGSTRWLDADQLAPGMVMLVAAGESLAADGEIIEGSTTIRRKSTRLNSSH